MKGGGTIKKHTIWLAVIAALILAAILISVCRICLRRISGAGEEISAGNPEVIVTESVKTIESDEIVTFRTNFWYVDGEDETASGGYCFDIQQTEPGTWLLTASGVYQDSIAVDESVLDRVQELVEEYELVKLNGVYSVMSALPPECSPCSMSVKYASGERLYFTCDGVPGTPWYTALHDYFLGLLKAEEE